MSDLRKMPRLFKVIRHRDLKEISGTGKVIDGVVFADGQVVIQWQNQTSSIAVFKNLADFQQVHVKPIFNENEFIWHEGYEPKTEVIEALNQAIEYVAVYKSGRINDKTRGDIIAKLIAIKNSYERQLRGGVSRSYEANIERNKRDPVRLPAPYVTGTGLVKDERANTKPEGEN